MLYPLFWLVSSSFKPQSIIFTDSNLWPTPFTFENYDYGWNALRTSFGVFFLNSFFITGLIVIGNVFSCSVTAFAFARLDFKFRRVWFALMLGTIMLPFHVTVIPQYIMFNTLGWINTYYPLIVPHFFAVDAFFIFPMCSSFAASPLSWMRRPKWMGQGHSTSTAALSCRFLCPP